MFAWYRCKTCILAGFLAGLLAAPAAWSIEVELVSGEVLKADGVSSDRNWVQVDHRILGTLRIPSDQVARVGLGPPQNESPGEPAPKTAAPPPEQPPKSPQKKKVWSFSVDFSAYASEGNSQETNLRFASKAKRKEGPHLTQFDNTYYTNYSNRRKSHNEVRSTLAHDTFIRDVEITRYSIFTRMGYHYDEFKEWRNRFHFQVGPGYRVVDTPAVTWTVRAGAGFRKEFGGESQEFNPESNVNTELHWQISDLQALDFQNTIYPSLEDLGEYRNLTTIEWSSKLRYSEHLSMKTGIENAYESHTLEEDVHNDIKAYMALGVNF